MNIRRSGKVPVRRVADILIAVTLAVAIAAIVAEAWIGAHEPTYNLTGATPTPLQITSTRFVNNGTGYITLTIKAETRQVTVGQVKVNNVAAIIDSTSTLTYAPSMSGSITLDNVTWSDGNLYLIALYDSSGNGVASIEQNAP
jgi:hypothetical protein